MAIGEVHERIGFSFEMDAFDGDERVGSALHDVLKEIDRQVGKWGVQSHSQANWYAILGEEFGEVGKAICEIALSTRGLYVVGNLREELIQTAAVAIAMVESLERCGFGGAA